MKSLFTLFATTILFLGSMINAVAQTTATHPITVQRTNGTTDYYTDINRAFANLTEGSTVYISGGHYVLSDADSVKIKCRVSIFGVGSRYTEAMQPITRVEGPVYFETGSTGSLIMGIDVLWSSYSVVISVAQGVSNILIKNCRAYQIKFSGLNYGCVVTGTIATSISGGYSPITISNSILSVSYVKGGKIVNCILSDKTSYYLYGCTNCVITNCVGMGESIGEYSSSGNNQFASNMLGNDNQQISYPTGGLSELFVKYDPANPFDLTLNDYRLKDGAPGKNAGLDGKDIGIYGGDGFDDAGGSLTPRIVFKEIAPTTTADGKLNVKIKVTAN